MKHVLRKVIIGIAALVLLLGGGVVIFYFLLKETTQQVDGSTVAAIDSANTITDPNWFKKAYQQGYRLYIIHSTTWGTCSSWPQAEGQLKMAVDAGLKVAAYTRDPSCYKQGIEATGQYKDELQFFALDIENDPGVKVTRAMVDGVKSLGIRPVIYTGSGMWSQVQQKMTNEFADVPLWDTAATYDAVPANWKADITMPKLVAYGGWNTTDNPRIGVQQYFEYSLNGVKVDVNSFNTSFLK